MEMEEEDNVQNTFRPTLLKKGGSSRYSRQKEREQSEKTGFKGKGDGGPSCIR